MKQRVMRILQWLLLLPLAAGATSPVAPVDSMRALLRQPGLPDTQRVMVLDELCWQLNRTDLAQARQYGEQGLRLARRIRYGRGEARLLNDLGTAALYVGDRLSAQRYYSEGVALVRRQGPPRLLGHLLMGLANVAVTQNDYPRAIGLFRQARAAYARHLPPAVADEALILHNIGLCYEDWGKPRQAMAVLREAARLFQQGGDSSTVANVLVSLAATQRHTQPDSALTLLRQAVALARRTENRLAEITALTRLGGILLEEKDLPAQALAPLTESVHLARRYQSEDHLAQGLEMLATALRLTGQPVAAFDTLRTYLRLHDTLVARARVEAIARQQVRYDVAQQQARITSLDLQRRQALEQAAHQSTVKLVMLGVAVVIALGLGLLAISYHRLRRSERSLTRSEAELRRTNRTKDRLLSIIGHDMRAPVAAFQQVAGMLRYYLRRPDANELAELADELEHDAASLGTLVDNLLHWARTQIGEVANRPVVMDPAVVVSVVIDLHQSLARAKRQTLTADLLAATVQVCADPDLLSTVLRNLVGNAIKFTPEGGAIVVRVRAEGDTIEFTVCDTGRGLTPRQLERLFGPDPTSARGTSGETGTGLGLAVCHQFVRLMGGELRVSSTPGEGSCFRFEVPAMEANPAALAESDRPAVVPAGNAAGH